MSAADVVAVVAAVTVAVMVGSLAAALVAMTRTLRALRDAADAFRSEAVPLLDDLRVTVHDAGREVERVDRLVTSAERLNEAVDSASRTTYRMLASPVVKAMALGAGVSRARTRLRDRDDRATERVRGARRRGTRAS